MRGKQGNFHWEMLLLPTARPSTHNLRRLSQCAAPSTGEKTRSLLQVPRRALEQQGLISQLGEWFVERSCLPPSHSVFCSSCKFPLSHLNAGEHLREGWDCARPAQPQPRWDPASERDAGFVLSSCQSWCQTSHFHPCGNSLSLISPKTAAKAEPRIVKYTGQIFRDCF